MRNMIRTWLRQRWERAFGGLDGQYVRELNQAVGPSCATLLDVGCGFNSPVQSLERRPLRMVGVDGYLPVIEQSRARGIHDEYHEMSLLDIEEKFGPKSFDCVLASDVIEHFEEADARELIRQMERVARKKVILYTPNGFLPQGEEYGNSYQRHLSGWTARQMEILGYRVVGIEGLRWLRGEMARIRWRPWRLWFTASLLSQAIVRDRPRFAFRILCVKELS
jgi:2-polyprenyl-3-methyl-5-hydroxy-6-metoxy-1,4-benzoquinol methylase